MKKTIPKTKHGRTQLTRADKARSKRFVAVLTERLRDLKRTPLHKRRKGTPFSMDEINPATVRKMTREAKALQRICRLTWEEASTVYLETLIVLGCQKLTPKLARKHGLM